MRRRFGRGRRRPSGNGASEPLDATHWLGRLSESGAFELGPLEALEVEGVPAHFALLARTGEQRERRALVAFSPERGIDALLALLAAGVRRRREGDEDAEMFALAPDWSAADRRALAALSPALPVTCAAVSGLSQGGRLRPEPPEPVRFEPRLLSARLDRPDEQQLCRRALIGLEGLAAKHAGALRGIDDRVELLVLARRCAALVADRGRLRIEVYEPERTTLPLAGGDALATALDRLEGLLRKLLNDRRERGGEGGLRAALAPLLARAADLVASEAWPLSGPDGDPLDWVGLTAEGRVCVAASTEQLDLPGLARVLGAAPAASTLAPLLSERAGCAPAPGVPRLWLAAAEFEAAALDALSASGLEAELFTARARRNGERVLESLSLPAAQAAGLATEAPAPPAERAAAREPAPRAESPAESRADSGPPPPATETGEEGSGPRFEEVSLFDLDDEAAEPAEGTGRRRRRRRGRRGRSGDGARAARDAEGGEDDADRGEAPESRRRSRRTARTSSGEAAEDDDDADDVDLDSDDDTLAPLAADAPDLDDSEALLEADGDEEEDESDAGEEERASERARRERELRRRARSSKTPEPPPPPRRRAAFVAHADRVSVLTAVILARDVRLVESFWVYPQSDLMTFFRSVATDLGEQTPIFLVGFSASPPARDTLQSASLYGGRLDWFDHHDWPPEDLEALRATLGAEHVHVQPGAESSLAAVIAERTRRSRFSDKLAELVTGRFTQHDYERWGRWWWHHVGELATRRGDRKADVAPLLTGRPSDLAKAVAAAEEAPLPPELAFVSERDFRLVHCAGLSMVVLEVPEELDLHLCARIARERYEAELSLATSVGRDLVVWSSDDSRTRRSLDLGGLAEHLANKHTWVEALPDDDNVARVRVRDLRTRPERLDDLIGEIAMGRSIVEG